MSIKYANNLTIKDRLQEFSDYWLEQINNVITGKAKQFDEDARDGEYWNDLREALLIPSHDANNMLTIDEQHHDSMNHKMDIYSESCRFIAEQKKAVFNNNRKQWSSTLDAVRKKTGFNAIQQAGDYARNLLTDDAVPLHIAVCNYNMIRIYDTDVAKIITAGKARTGDTFLSEFTLDEFAQHEDDLKTLFNINIKDYNATRLNDTQVIDTSRKAAVFVQELKASLKKAYENDLKYLKSYDPLTGKHAYDYNDDLAKLVTIIVFAFYADDAGMLGGYNKIIGRILNSKEYESGYLSDGTQDLESNNANMLRERLKELIISFTEPDYNPDGSFNENKYDSISDENIIHYHFPYLGDIFNENSKNLFTNVYIPHDLSSYNVYQLLVRMAAAHSNDFHWRDVDAVMFGSMMEGMFSHDSKISNGIYWTPRKYIHMVIDPVFIRNKTLELDKILNDIENSSHSVSDDAYSLDEYINSLADYRIMDPACGSGNFLTETYLTMRRLENKALKALIDIQGTDGLREIRVKPSQFYGIEINDYACIVARMSMAIAETRALQELKELIPSYRNPMDYPYFPIKGGCTIINHNALTELTNGNESNSGSEPKNKNANIKIPFDWGTVMPLGLKNTHGEKHGNEIKYGNGIIYDCKYLIIGNPPFIGYQKLDDSMSDDLNVIYGLKQGKTHPRVDYCSCWYIQAANYLKDTKNGEFSFVSTANICKGEQPRLWFDKVKNQGWLIQTAWKSFKWSNDSKDAAPAVIIMHLSKNDGNNANKYILTDKALTGTNDYNDVNDYEYHKVSMINRYLDDNEDVFIAKNPVLISSEMTNVSNGSLPNGKELIIKKTDNDYEALMNDNIAKPFIREYVGADELVNNNYNHCIYILNETDYKTACQSALLKARFDKVHKQRLHGGRDGFKLRDKPYLFIYPRAYNVKGHQLIIPSISSSQKYMQCGYVNTDIVASNAVFTCLDETGLNFSIIETRSFMKWQAYLGGSLFGATRFANTLTWNNYPLPSLTDEMRNAIINAGRNILTVRDELTDSKTGRKLTLAEMYKTMPPALQSAHTRLDLLVDSVIHDYATGTDGSFNELVEARVSAFNEGLKGNVSNSPDSTGKAVRNANTSVNEPILIKDVNNDDYTDAFIELYGSDAVYSDDDRIRDLLKAYVIMTEQEK